MSTQGQERFEFDNFAYTVDAPNREAMHRAIRTMATHWERINPAPKPKPKPRDEPKKPWWRRGGWRKGRAGR